MAALLAACSTVRDESAAACTIAPLAHLVGRPATAELGSEAMRRSGGTRLRWIRPGAVVTMDYSETRLNIHLDPRDRVGRFVCG
ncbi:MAG: I78 family peptidase inhibitor [Allosphingosinicella sp.]